MARSIATIEADLDASISTAISNPSSSMYAEWKLWRSIFARAIWVFETIIDTFKLEVETTVQTKQYASFDWYHDRIMEFQGETLDGGAFQGDNLMVQNGIISYETPDETRRIIRQASLRANNGVLGIKLAKALTETTYQQLTESELVAFNIYFLNIKYPGTRATVVSLPADLVKYNLKIVYDPIYSTATVTTNIQEKLEEYRQSLGFDDRVFLGEMLNFVQAADGVVSVTNNGSSAKGYSDEVFTTIDQYHTLESGYFNYDENSALTFTSKNAIV